MRRKVRRETFPNGIRNTRGEYRKNEGDTAQPKFRLLFCEKINYHRHFAPAQDLTAVAGCSRWSVRQRRLLDYLKRTISGYRKIIADVDSVLSMDLLI